MRTHDSVFPPSGSDLGLSLRPFFLDNRYRPTPLTHTVRRAHSVARFNTAGGHLCTWPDISPDVAMLPDKLAGSG